MEIKVQNMQAYNGYIQCGIILKSPKESYQCPYVLQCFQCKETYLLLESFIFHIETHCQDLVEANNKCTSEIEDISVNLDLVRNFNDTNVVEMEYEGGANEQITVKQEDTTITTDLEDPLTVVKSEIVEDDEVISTKEKSKLADKQIEKTSSAVDAIELTKKDLFDITEQSEDNYEMDESSCNEESSPDDSESDKNESKNKRVKKSVTKQGGSSSNKLKIQTFMKSQANVKALIDAYKNQPSLWNKNFPALRHKEKRREFLQVIAQDLKDQIDFDISVDQVACLISHLCQKYRDDLKGIKDYAESDDKSNVYTPLWFFEELYFLKPFVENNLMAKLDSHLPELLPHEILQIIDIYKGLPNLWNTHIIEYYCKNKRNEALKEMLGIMEPVLNIKITEHILEEYLRTVHNCFSRTKRKKLKITPKKGEQEYFEVEQTKHNYYEHMIFLHDHVGPFKCSECDREIKGSLSYKIHKSQHDGSAPLSCSVCKKEFTSPSTYTNHARRHMEDTRHECKECGKKFYASRELNIHMRDHTGAKPFCCEICGASFRHVQGFTNHRRRHDKNYLHTCHICSKGYYTADRFKDHMNAHTNTRSHICNVCGKAFINKKGLQQHAVIHEDIRKYSCKLCGKTFKHKTGVNQHMRTHGIPKCEEYTVNKGLELI